VDTNAEQIDEKGAGGQWPISLVIPCKAEYVGLCRLIAGVVGAHESLDEDVIADLKLVVTEACTCFVLGSEGDLSGGGVSRPDRPGAPGFLRIEFHIIPDSWEISVFDPDHRRHLSSACRCDPLSEGGLGLTIIKALVDKVEQLDSESEGSVLRLVKRLPARRLPAD